MTKVYCYIIGCPLYHIGRITLILSLEISLRHASRETRGRQGVLNWDEGREFLNILYWWPEPCQFVVGRISDILISVFL